MLFFECDTCLQSHRLFRFLKIFIAASNAKYGDTDIIFQMRTLISSASLTLALAALLAACNPAYNWRDHVARDGSFQVQFPAKPAVDTRNIDLGGSRIDMMMTAAQVEGTTFAVGTAITANAAQAQAALPAMRQALLRNIGAADSVSDAQTGGASLSLDASGRGPGGPVRIVGRFSAKGTRVYQVIVVGTPGAMLPEHTEQFLSSFKPQ